MDLLGRGSERRRLHDFLGRIVAGEKRILLLHGAAGTGKSSLISWLVSASDASGLKSISIRAGHSLFPSIQDLCEQIESEAVTHAPRLAGRGEDNQLQRQRPTDAAALVRLSWILRELALDRPVMLAIDDLDHLPNDRIELLLEVFRMTHGPIGLIATMQSLPKLTPHPLAVRPSVDLWIEAVHLQGLDLDAFDRLAEEVLGQPLAPSSLLRIFETCDGNPFLGIELLHHLRLGGQLASVGPVQVLRDIVLDNDTLPASLIDAFALRIESLPAPHLLILQVLALLGRPVGLAALQELCGARSVIDDVSSLERHRLVRADGTGYRIAHPLYEQTLRARLSTTDRARLHARILLWLETTAISDSHGAEALALHAREADLSPRRIAALLLLAGEEAMRNGRYKEAVRFFTQAREHGPSQEDVTAVGKLAHAWEHVDPDKAVSLYREALDKTARDPSLMLGLASALRKQGRFQEALATLQSATGLATGDLAFEASRAMGIIYAIRGDREAAVTTFSRLVEQASRTGHRAVAEGHLAQAHFLSGREREGHDLLQSAYKVVTDPADRLHMANNLAWMKIVLGDWQDADQLLSLTVNDSAAAFDNYHLAALLTIHARLAAWQGNVAESLERSSRAVLYTKALGNPADIIGALDSLALAFLEAGRIPDALAAVHEIESYLNEELEPREIALTFVIAGDTYLAAEEVDHAVRACDLAHSHLAEAEHLTLAAHRLRAEIALRSGKPGMVRELLSPALATTGFALERASALALQARADALTGARSDALDTAKKALADYEALGAKNRAQSLRDWLTQNATRPRGRPRSHGPQGLTPREIDVLWMVTKGQTNREIASSLFISEGTVNKHVDNIKKKAGVSRRTELVIFAGRLGIHPGSPPYLPDQRPAQSDDLPHGPQNVR